MQDRSRVMTYAARDAPILQVEGWDETDRPHPVKNLCGENTKNASDGTDKQKTNWL